MIPVLISNGQTLLRYCAEALLQSRPLPHIPALPDGDPPNGSGIQPISQQVNIQQHSGVSSAGLLEAANRLQSIFSSFYYTRF